MAKLWNGWLMSRDSILADIKDNRITVRNERLLPLYFRLPAATLEGWLDMRSIDTGRQNSRLLRRALGLSDVDRQELVMSVNAAMITDTYWIKDADSNLSWDNVRFQGNDFADIALLGAFSDFGKDPSRTPEITNTGSFEKCWRLEDGQWWLYKQGDPENLFSEMAAYQLCRHAGYPTAQYELVDAQHNGFAGKLKGGRGLIRTLDFTQAGTVIFEPASALGQHSDNAQYNYDLLQRLSPELSEQYLQILTMDVLVFNLDRHGKNYGVLRNPETGDILSMAPNFDNNLSLLAGIQGMGERTPERDPLYREWKGVVQNRLLPLDLPELPEDRLWELLSGIKCDIDPDEVKMAGNFILKGYAMMQETTEQMRRFQQGMNQKL